MSIELRMVVENLDAWKSVSGDDYSDFEDDPYGADLMRIEMSDGRLHYFVREHDDDDEPAEPEPERG